MPFDASVSQGVMDDLNAAPEGGDESQAPVEAPTPQAPQAQPPAGLTRAQEEMWEIKHGGKPIKLTRSQMTEYAQKGYDYTGKTQQLAEVWKDYNTKQQQWATYEREKGEIIAFLKDKGRLQQYLAELAKSEGGSAQPDEVVTAQQMQDYLRHQAQAIMSQTQAHITKSQQEAEFKSTVSRLESEYDTTATRAIAAAMEKYPFLDAVDDISDLLRNDVFRRYRQMREENPQYLLEPQEIQAFIAEAADARAKKLQARFTANTKEAAVRAAKLKTSGIEPPGGSSTEPSPKRKMKWGSADIRSAVISDIEAALAAKSEEM